VGRVAHGAEPVVHDDLADGYAVSERFGKCAVALRIVLDQDRSLSALELLLLENHFYGLHGLGTEELATSTAQHPPCANATVEMGQQRGQVKRPLRRKVQTYANGFNHFQQLIRSAKTRRAN